MNLELHHKVEVDCGRTFYAFRQMDESGECAVCILYELEKKEIKKGKGDTIKAKAVFHCVEINMVYNGEIILSYYWIMIPLLLH